MPARITGTAFSGSPLRRGYVPPQPSYERIQGISQMLNRVLNVPQQALQGAPGNPAAMFQRGAATGAAQQAPVSSAPFDPSASIQEMANQSFLAGDRIGMARRAIRGIGQQAQNSITNQRQRIADQQSVLDQETRRDFSPSNVWEQNSRMPNVYRDPGEISPLSSGYMAGIRNQQTNSDFRMMPGGEQMQDRFMGGSPLAAQANYLAQGQALTAAGLGTMIPGPYGQIGQFVEKRPGVMEAAEAAMPGRLAIETDQPASGFTRRNEGGLAYTSRAQALRDAGQERAAQDLEARQAERVARVKRDREAAGLPVGPAARRAERDQKKMDRMVKIQGRQLQRMGVSPLSPQAALFAPEAFKRAKTAMQGGDGGGGASPLISAAGQPVTPVEQNAARTPVSIDQAKNAYDAILRNTPLFAAAGVELGTEYTSAPPLNQVVPKVNDWLKQSGGTLSEQDLEGLHTLAIQATHSANTNEDPFAGSVWNSSRTQESLNLMKQLAKIPKNDTKARQQWWGEYSQKLFEPDAPGWPAPADQRVSPLEGSNYDKWKKFF